MDWEAMMPVHRWSLCWPLFCIFPATRDLPYNLIFAATAEEEISGEKGVSSILDDLGKIDLGIVGEPTNVRWRSLKRD